MLVPFTTLRAKAMLPRPGMRKQSTPSASVTMLSKKKYGPLFTLCSRNMPASLCPLMRFSRTCARMIPSGSYSPYCPPLSVLLLIFTEEM